VDRRLGENDLKPWRKDVWCISQVDAEYIARTEAPLALAAARMNDPPRPDCLAEVVDGVSGLVAAVSGPLGGCASD
jgi:hypothetical protein